MKTLSPFIVSFALLASACTVGPDFKAPKPPATSNYTSTKETLASDQHIVIGKQIEAEWWKLFASKPLNDVIRQAIADNYDITAAKETLAEAEEAVNAETGGLFPQVSLNAIAGKQKYGVALFGPSDFVIPPFSYYEAGQALSWTPDLFGGTRRGIEKQRALAEYQAHQLDAAYITLTGNVVVQSLTIAAMNAEIATTEQIIAEDEKTLDMTQKAFRSGADTKLDILTAKSQCDSDQALLPPLRQRLSIARHALSILTGKAPADWMPPDFAANGFTLPKELPLSLPSELVRKRPDILAAEANLHAASAAIGIATANLYPNITLSANTLQEALAPSGLFEGTNNAWSLLGGLTAPVFSGGTLTAEKREAEHAYQAALAQYRQTILYAFGQVADALTALTHDAESIKAEQQAIETASASLDLARKSYQSGNSNLLQIEEAERQLARAKLGFIRAQSQRFLDTTQLFVALSGSPV